MPPNQNPEQSARDRIDRMLGESGWVVQDKKAIDFNPGPGIAVREYQTDIGPADYALFVDKKAVGVIEAKKEISAKTSPPLKTRPPATPTRSSSGSTATSRCPFSTKAPAS